LGLSRQAGVLGGIAGTLILVWPGNGEELAGIVLGLLAVAFLHRWTSGLGSFGGSLLLGIACGIAFHLQPVLLPVVLGWMTFELWWSRERRKWYLSTAIVLGMVIACIPWGLRNYTVFNDVFFIRSNLGLELRMGNHEGAAGDMEVMDAIQEHRHPRTHLQEAQLVRDLGEAEYMRLAGIEALEWIRAHPGEFVKLTVSRTTQFWFGPFHEPWMAVPVTGLTILALLGAWYWRTTMTKPQRVVIMMPLIFYPLIYYIVAYMPRYRVPLDWILYLLAGAAVWHWLKGRC
jgi:4-amino-4-deoxy-L-arabinose transferase-like glycosyltransferase